VAGGNERAGQLPPVVVATEAKSDVVVTYLSIHGYPLCVFSLYYRSLSLRPATGVVKRPASLLGGASKRKRKSIILGAGPFGSKVALQAWRRSQIVNVVSWDTDCARKFCMDSGLVGRYRIHLA
jgi:hypothetical protein